MGIVAARHNYVAMDGQTPHTGLVSSQDPPASACDNVPDSQSRIPRARNGRVSIGHLQTSHRRIVATKSMQAFAGQPRQRMVLFLLSRISQLTL